MSSMGRKTIYSIALMAGTALVFPATAQAQEAGRRELLLQPIVRAGGHENAPIVDPVLLRELTVQRVDPAAEAAAYDELADYGVDDRGGLFLEAVTSSLRTFFEAKGAGVAEALCFGESKRRPRGVPRPRCLGPFFAN